MVLVELGMKQVGQHTCLTQAFMRFVCTDKVLAKRMLTNE